MVVANIISWITLTTPSRVGFKHYAMLVVSPSHNAAGPSVWLGPFGSCGRPNASFETHCTDLGFKYGLSVFPKQLHFTLHTPPFWFGVWLLLTALLLTIFLVSLTIMTAMLWAQGPPERFLNYRYALAWAAFVLSFIGSVNISILELHFQTSRHMFNVIIRTQGSGLVASRGESIKLAYAAYVLVVVPFLLITKDVANVSTNDADVNPMVTHLLSLGPTTARTPRPRRPDSPNHNPKFSPNHVDGLLRKSIHRSTHGDEADVANVPTTAPTPRPNPKSSLTPDDLRICQAVTGATHRRQIAATTRLLPRSHTHRINYTFHRHRINTVHAY